MNPTSKISPKKRHQARRLALQAIYQWQINHDSIATIHEQYAADHCMKKADQEYFFELLQGVIRQVDELDTQLTPFLDRAFNELNPIEMAGMRIGAYELIYRLELPYRIVINEAVEIVKEFGSLDGHKYVNGVLDKLAASVRKTEFLAGKN